jgi:hypothetical protein
MDKEIFLIKIGEFETKILNIMSCYQQGNYELKIRSSDLLVVRDIYANLADFMDKNYLDEKAGEKLRALFQQELEKNKNSPQYSFLESTTGLIKSIRERVQYDPQKWIKDFQSNSELSPDKKTKPNVTVPLSVPERITIPWLIKHCHYTVWGALISALAAACGVGFKCGIEYQEYRSNKVIRQKPMAVVSHLQIENSSTREATQTVSSVEVCSRKIINNPKQIDDYFEIELTSVDIPANSTAANQQAKMKVRRIKDNLEIFNNYIHVGCEPTEITYGKKSLYISILDVSKSEGGVGEVCASSDIKKIRNQISRDYGKQCTM